MKAGAEKAGAEEASAEEATLVEAPEQAHSDAQKGSGKGPRRSGRLSKSRTISPDH